jgi:hypothetical protein
MVDAASSQSTRRDARSHHSPLVAWQVSEAWNPGSIVLPNRAKTLLAASRGVAQVPLLRKVALGAVSMSAGTEEATQPKEARTSTLRISFLRRTHMSCSSSPMLMCLSLPSCVAVHRLVSVGSLGSLEPSSQHPDAQQSFSLSQSRSPSRVKRSFAVTARVALECTLTRPIRAPVLLQAKAGRGRLKARCIGVGHGVPDTLVLSVPRDVRPTVF